jgi:hypothetical protein
MLMTPPRPLVASPDCTTIQPLLPLAAGPVLNVTAPEEPAVPPGDVIIVTAPEPELLLAPVMIDTAPPNPVPALEPPNTES